MVTVNDVIRCVEEFAPVNYQESYDNSGLQVGNSQMQVNSVLLTLDVTEEVVDEAISIGANMILAHHPLIFGNLKRLTGKNYVERTLLKAIKNDIAIYACHTNIDNMGKGVSYRMGEKLGLTDMKVLKPMPGDLCKLVSFVPSQHAEVVRNALFEAGAGHIGNYDKCSYNVQGVGSFRAAEGTNPFVGEIGKIHFEPETRVETIFAKSIEQKIIKSLLSSHPYEEVAFDIYPLNNVNPNVGAGIVGLLPLEVDEAQFLFQLKEIFKVSAIRHTNFINKKIKKVALCGGSGSFLLSEAKAVGADVFITGDFKYHQFFDAESKILIADIGHFESEQYTLEIFYELLIKKLPNFAICFTKTKTNPINYI